jgi:DNA-binding MarR family transcriptional regulator
MAARRRLPTVPDPSAPSLPAAVTSAVGFLTNEVAALFRITFEQVLVAHRLRPRQYLMLLVLRDEGPMSQQHLGQRLGMDRTTTMQLVQALADMGAVDREDDPADKRVYRVSLTTDGRRLTATLEGRIKKVESTLLSPLTVSERVTFSEQLRAILAGVQGRMCVEQEP